MLTEADVDAAETPSAIETPKARAHLVDIPEPVGYRIKNKVLGPPLFNDQLEHERLGKPTALAVFASDNLSSSAYATEEILRVLIPVIGLAAFTLVLPITIAMLVVLGFLILSYRQTIKAYPSAGGAYIVTKDNFGLFWAQVAGVSLLTDYILTASVSTAAGAAALASAFPGLASYTLPIAIVFIMIIAAGNLKGVRESGKAFAIPTYFFVANMAVLLGVGIYKIATGALTAGPIDVEGAVAVGSSVDGFFAGASLFVVMHAFASGGAAVTGVEAISNGVPAFREPSWKNARTTLVIMGSLLGFMFFGLSWLAAQVHPAVYASGTPTVISQIGSAVYDAKTSIGHIMWLSLQAGTMLILVLAANTAFADFPRLASFQASDNFMPRQLTKRGHRLVYSNGIIALAISAIVVLIATGAKVEHLIPLYAIGVFLGFTLSQSGMAKHHIRLKEPGWKVGLFINGAGAVLSFIVLMVIASTKFLHGAWVIIVLIPLAVVPLFRLNKQYESEEEELESAAGGAGGVIEQKIMNRHVVIVLIDSLDMASARAAQYARALTPDELFAVHFDLDPVRTRDITDAWTRLGFSRLALEVVECPDRRIERAAAEVVARQLIGGDTEVTVLLPRREYTRFWHRLVHDRTADSIAETLSQLPHCNVTIVPFHLGKADEVSINPALVLDAAAVTPNGSSKRAKKVVPPTINLGGMSLPEDRVPIDQLAFRQRAKVAGKVYSMRVQPWSGVASLELTIIDDTGALLVVFFGRRQLAGVVPGTRVSVEGVIGEHRNNMAMLNPAYEIRIDAHP